ncbi:MAG: hypothetical protein IT349_14625 [Candidatus Eisenbacteria bacterium]|nr:hypothetical protein [Candidatus Eisenbacteria bacterium]
MSGKGWSILRPLRWALHATLICLAATAARAENLAQAVSRLESPTRQVWLSAANELVEAGDRAGRYLERRRNAVGNPRVAARIDSLLREIWSIRATLEVEPRTLRVGQPLDYRVLIRNATRATILLPLPTEGCEDGLRSPRIELELIAPDGQPAGLGPTWARAGELDRLRADDFVRLPRGAETSLWRDGAPRRLRAPGHWYWAPPGPGLYRLRFIYDCTERNWNDWLGRSTEPELDVKQRWMESFRGRIVSNWVTLNVTE